MLEAAALEPSAIASAPTEAAALLPMAMPLVDAAATDDCPPMAMESTAVALAPAVALPPMAVEPAAEAVTAVVPPPMATEFVPVALESSSTELTWKYLTPPPLVIPAKIVSVANNCEPFTASVEVAEICPADTFWI